MLIQRNFQQHQSELHTGVLKGMLKWRDFTGRKEDESPSYIMPNHVLFQVVNEMPSNKNELKDCWRSASGQGMMLKFQDEVLQVVLNEIEALKNKKMDLKKPNTHIKLENSVQAAKNPEYVEPTQA